MNIIELVQQYDAIKEQEKVLASRKKELSEQIKKYAIEHGQQDSKGSSYRQEGGYTFGNVARKTIKLNSDKALAYLTEHKPDIVGQVLETVQIVSEKKLEELFSEGLITSDELEQMVDTKVTYSVSVVKDKTEDTEEVVEVKTAPRVKKILKKK